MLLLHVETASLLVNLEPLMGFHCDKKGCIPQLFGCHQKLPLVQMLGMHAEDQVPVIFPKEV